MGMVFLREEVVRDIIKNTKLAMHHVSHYPVHEASPISVCDLDLPVSSSSGCESPGEHSWFAGKKAGISPLEWTTRSSTRGDNEHPYSLLCALVDAALSLVAHVYPSVAKAILALFDFLLSCFGKAALSARQISLKNIRNKVMIFQ
ncbi:hypothetical protein HPB50_004613 [Hyalomma asiaticum]|uniref:Uncharacterized protein n=1 Tax=Hyalomma asiaticum TaxID=266040 RepID=A0ACB7TC59_HYAAI|nr:hypothetical protein HPB50_004613 [Hyalomma asiaticum]